MTDKQSFGPLWRMPTVQRHVGLCSSSIRNYVRNGMFPKPVQLGARAVAWRASDVEEWMKTRVQKD